MTSFNWESMRKFIFGTDVMQLETMLFDEVKKNLLLLPSPGETEEQNELHRQSVQKAFTYTDIGNKIRNDRNGNEFIVAWVKFGAFVGKGPGIQAGICNSMFPDSIREMGSERHLKYVQEIKDGKIVGGFCLTEIAHGSNTKMVQTEAVYDKSTREFVLTTPNFRAAKCWSGNTGKFATHVILYAQLIIPDKGNYGLHAFIVPIRDTRTLLPYPGITVTDMGNKIGLQQIDNGMLMFSNYRIAKENLLNKLGDVDEKGQYIPQIQNQRKQYLTSLGILSIGRNAIVLTSTWNLTLSLVIAFRYLETMKQDTHLPAMHKSLIPYLSAVYVTMVFSRCLSSNQKTFMLMIEKNEGNFAEMGMELHALLSAAKPLISWVARDGIQKCMEICSSHGYQKASGLDQFKRTHDANCTYEGDNNVLIQQTANWLIKLWPSIKKGKLINFPLSSVSFLTKDILISKFTIVTTQEFANPNNLLKQYRWLITYLLKKYYEKNNHLLQNDHLSAFWAKNENQVYFGKDLSTAFLEHYIIQVMNAEIQKADDENVRTVLEKLLTLYAVWSLQKYVHLFYEGGYANDARFAEFIEKTILDMCHKLRSEQIALIDAMAAPDFLENGVLGHKEGQVYERMEGAILQYKGVFSKPKWTGEVYKEKYSKAKL